MSKDPVPSCLLCATQENYCFNSPADVFALLEVRKRKKLVRRWLSNLIFLQRVKWRPDAPIFICEVHYAKDDLDRVVRENGKTEVKLASEQALPCYLKLEDRALNNRIKSFLFLVEEHEKCLNMGNKWLAKVFKDKRFALLLGNLVKIEISENLEATITENGEIIALEDAIKAGFVENNRRIMFWSRLRGMMKHYEEKYASQQVVVVVPEQIITKPGKVGRPRKFPKVEIPKIVEKKPLKVIVPAVNAPEEEEISTTTSDSDSSSVENATPTFKIFKSIPQEDLPVPKIVQATILPKNFERPVKRRISENITSFTKMYKMEATGPKELKTTLSDPKDDIVTDILPLIPSMIRNCLPTWHVISRNDAVCTLKIVIVHAPDGTKRPYIVKAVKVDQNLVVTGYLNGQKIQNDDINRHEKQLSQQELVEFMQNIDDIPFELPKSVEIHEKIVKNDPDQLSFGALAENLNAFSGNNWKPTCIDNEVILIYKIDFSDVPKFKRYITIDRDLTVTIFNNGQNRQPGELLEGSFQMYPLTMPKIHRILSTLDETVFDKILRPSKYREKSFEENIRTEEDHRVMEGTVKRHKCTLCVYESDTLNYVKQHYEIKHTPPDRKCPECDKEMNATQLKIHARFHIKKVKCSICNKGFADSRDLKKHINVHNKPTDRFRFRQNALKPHNQQHSDSDDSLLKHEPCMKLEDTDSGRHSMSDEDILKAPIRMDSDDEGVLIINEA